jgi:hypothetical protein
MSRIIFFGLASLQGTIRQFPERSHTQRNHMRFENRLLHPASAFIGYSEFRFYAKPVRSSSSSNIADWPAADVLFSRTVRSLIMPY